MAAIGHRGFAALFCCQLLAAFNDNVLRNALVVTVLWGGATGQRSGGMFVTLAGACFVLPYLVLSGLGGALADKLDKALLAERLKRWELAVAAVAAVGLLLHNLPLLFVALLGFGAIAALFAPLKYAILPELLDRPHLPLGNALIEGATFLAILAGGLCGTLVTATRDSGIAATLPIVTLVLAASLFCWLAARAIPALPAALPDLAVPRRPLGSSLALLGGLRREPGLWRASLYAAWFWLTGTLVLAMLPVVVHDTLAGGTAVASLALLAFSLGIGGGTLLGARLVRRRPGLSLCRPATVAMGLLLLDLARRNRGLSLALSGTGIVVACSELMLLAAAAGLLVVPAMTMIQVWSPVLHRARHVGGGNVLSALAMLIGTGLATLGQALGLSALDILGLLGAACLPAGLLMSPGPDQHLFPTAQAAISTNRIPSRSLPLHERAHAPGRDRPAFLRSPRLPARSRGGRAAARRRPGGHR
ncbi:MFS transporter [Lichenicoccus sp.]|uniref:MFS transporter n=1 Tax=Lichenicoccus sp. TaxID=2781899 RepID=UPI003D10D278